MDFENEYMDVLQNIEIGIVSVYNEDPDLTDYEVERALEALTSYYIAEKRNRSPKKTRLKEQEQLLFDRMQAMCEWRLGRNPMTSGEGEELTPDPITVDEIILCLKRLIKSVRKWNKRGGRQGYLNFVSQFVK